MSAGIRLLLVDPLDDPALRTELEQQYGFTVTYLPQADDFLAVVRRVRPDAIALNARLTQPSTRQLLADLPAHELTPPVVLIGANTEAEPLDFNYPHIIGWLDRLFTAGELALLINTALEQPLPTKELVLTKRTALVETNQRLAYRLQELQTLFEIGKNVTSLLDLKTVLRRVVEAAVQLTGADESYLLLVDESDGDLYLRAEVNVGTEMARNFRVKTSDSIAGQVVQTGQPIILANNRSSLKIKTGLSVYSLVNVPLRMGDSVMGVLSITNSRRQRAFTQDDQELLSALADWAAIAIQNARLYDETRQFSRDLQLVTEVSQLVSGTLDVQQIPRLLLQRVPELVGAECGSLALIDKERGGVVFQLAYDSAGQEVKRMGGLVMPPDEGIVGMVAKTGLPMYTNDPQNHPAWSSLPDKLTGFVTEKILAAPLIAEGEVLGVIELLNKTEGDFTDEDSQLLMLVASSAAIAIQNARQYAALKQANQALHEAQEQRIAAERWAVLGKAAATLAHRINNSTALVPIAAQHTRQLLDDVELSPQLRQDIMGNLGRIERNSLHTVDLAAVLLRRFRKNPTEAHNINQLVEQALQVVEIPDNIKLVRHLDPDLPPVTTSNLLTDVFVELISNAVRAMADQPDGLLRLATFLADPKHVSVQITDNGPGIPPEHTAKIFDMFFTTTPNGLGFGLWWTKTFLEQQHGDISVKSTPGEGTTFTITLPRNLPSLPTF